MCFSSNEVGAGPVTIVFKAACAILAGSFAAAAADAATVTKFMSGVYQQVYGLTSDKTALYVSGTTAGFRDYSGSSNDGVIGKIVFHAPRSLVTLYFSANYATASGHISPF